MNSYRKLSEVAVISSAVTLVAVYIFVGSGGKLPGLNNGTQNPTNGSNISSTAEKGPIVMPSSKLKVLDFDLKKLQEQTASPAPQSVPAQNQTPAPTIMHGPKSAPVFPTVVNQGSQIVPNPSPASPENPNDPKRTAIFFGSKSATLPSASNSGAAQQIPPGSPGYQPASSSTPNVPAPQPFTSAPNSSLPPVKFSGNQPPQRLPTHIPAQQQTVPQYKVQK